MAKHKGRKSRYNSNFQAVKTVESLTIGALADGVVLKKTITGALTQDAYAISADTTWALVNPTTGEGPLQVGYASDDLTVTEITEALDASPVSKSDRIARERAGRPVRHVGMFEGRDGSDQVLNDGKAIRTKIMMPIAQTDLSVWIRNLSGATLTTGSILKIAGQLYLNWT